MAGIVCMLPSAKGTLISASAMPQCGIGEGAPDQRSWLKLEMQDQYAPNSCIRNFTSRHAAVVMEEEEEEDCIR